jgi:uncharacterized membrane protein
MQPSGMHYFPLAWPFILALFVLVIAVAAVIELNILRYAYERMGIPSRDILAILLLSLVGSAINIPIAELPPERMVSGRLVDFYGMLYVVPVVREWPGTVIAVNVGGALIPAILSLYLFFKTGLGGRGVLAVAAVALVVHLLASPVPGVGISVPIFVAPIVAALAAMALGGRHAAPLAYIAGSLGTLIGADLLNLDRIQGLGAPIASIGGAGTFDGVFMSGILAVLLSPVEGPRLGRSGGASRARGRERA